MRIVCNIPHIIFFSHMKKIYFMALNLDKFNYKVINYVKHLKYKDIVIYLIDI